MDSTISSAHSGIPQPGMPAPDFTLASTAGATFTLSSLRGSTAALLAFFPLAFTSTCTAEVCDFSMDFDQFSGAGATVLPISVDSVPTLREFASKYGIRLPMLSDFRREVSRAYGVLHEEKFFSLRAYFLIDRAGILRWRHVEENPGERRLNPELLAHIAHSLAS